jgi:hypothetical protein
MITRSSPPLLLGEAGPGAAQFPDAVIFREHVRCTFGANVLDFFRHINQHVGSRPTTNTLPVGNL